MKYKPKIKGIITDYRKASRILHQLNKLTAIKGTTKEKKVEDILKKFCQKDNFHTGTITYKKTIASSDAGHDYDFLITLNRDSRYSFRHDCVIHATPITFPLEIKSSLGYCLKHLNEWVKTKRSWAFILVVQDGATENTILQGIIHLFSYILTLQKINKDYPPKVMLINEKIFWVKIKFNGTLITAGDLFKHEIKAE